MTTANPLDRWTAAKLGSAGSPFSRSDLSAYQMRRLRETVAWARQHSPFYRRRLDGFDASSLNSPADLCRLPFTSCADLRRNDPPLLCVPRDEIGRMVAFKTSGTSGPAKSLFFTADDQEATVDFFRQGLALFTRPGDRVAVLFPGERPGSVGDLLADALRRLGATPVVAGWPQDPAAAAVRLYNERPDVVAGAPIAVLAVARYAPGLSVRNVLLSADHVSASLRAALERLWHCEIFEHYGMTEMGLGGGVDCSAHAGYHMRETELLVEIVDRYSGEPVPAGEPGEVVFSTLTRRGMPLIRYRTGDISRVLPEPCACGSPLLRLDRIHGRIGNGIGLGGAGTLTMAALDEALFACPEVVDFSASYRPGPPPGLHLEVSCQSRADMHQKVRDALAGIAALAQATTARGLRLSVALTGGGRLLNRTGKRRIALEFPS